MKMTFKIDTKTMYICDGNRRQRLY